MIETNIKEIIVTVLILLLILLLIFVVYYLLRQAILRFIDAETIIQLNESCRCFCK